MLSTVDGNLRRILKPVADQSPEPEQPEKNVPVVDDSDSDSEYDDVGFASDLAINVNVAVPNNPVMDYIALMKADLKKSMAMLVAANAEFRRNKKLSQEKPKEPEAAASQDSVWTKHSETGNEGTGGDAWA
jgi:hypothetical protein